MDLQVYKRTVRVKYRNTPLNLYQLSFNDQVRKWMRTHFADATTAIHKQLRDEAWTREKALQQEWWQIADTEFQRLFKRPMEVYDYKVSGVGREEFSESVKEKLRSLISEENKFAAIRYAHNLMLPKKLRIQ
jgi:predicted ATPase